MRTSFLCVGGPYHGLFVSAAYPEAMSILVPVKTADLPLDPPSETEIEGFHYRRLDLAPKQTVWAPHDWTVKDVAKELMEHYAKPPAQPIAQLRLVQWLLADCYRPMLRHAILSASGQGGPIGESHRFAIELLGAAYPEG